MKENSTKGYEKKVAWHDPCSLGWHTGIYDEPREVLKQAAGLELVEMADYRQDSLCCGGVGAAVSVRLSRGFCVFPEFPGAGCGATANRRQRPFFNERGVRQTLLRALSDTAFSG